MFSERREMLPNIFVSSCCIHIQCLWLYSIQVYFYAAFTHWYGHRSAFSHIIPSACQIYHDPEQDKALKILFLFIYFIVLNFF